MSKYLRYVIYMLIGVCIYYISGAKDDPEILSSIRSVVPAIIIGLVMILMIVKYIRSKKEKSDQ